MVAEAKPEWSTGLCDCCAEPGGWGLCCMAFCCDCFIAGKNGEWAGTFGGYWVSCITTALGWMPCICWYESARLTQLKAKQIKIGICPTFCIGCCCMGSCLNCQTRREQILAGADSGCMPGGEQASAALLSDNKKPGYAATSQF